MQLSTLLFLSSGMILGWSLGANDAANVFGTAVGSRMVRFRTAAWVCGIALTLGAVLGGAGATHGLGKLGAIDALPGAFTVALAAGLTVFWMTRIGLPVSTTQAIVGAIVGWNMFSHHATDWGEFRQIFGTWVACPILGGLFAAAIYQALALFLRVSKLHLLRLDHYTRWGLLLAGAFGSYSLGANNIANVVGVFVPDAPFQPIVLTDSWVVSPAQQLFFLGAIAISVGVFTYSRRVMMTVGQTLMPLTPVAAWVVVVSHSLVLFIFSSTTLRDLFLHYHLPPIPLIPVSSSQAVVGAVIGLGFLKGRKGIRQIRWKVLLQIASGWFSTPLVAGVLAYLMLFVIQNVFQLPVVHN